MAEIKNNFLQSKMNKDLDDRLIPNGQYRDALNIQVGKSEQDDIGTLQSILGNHNLPIPADDTDLICIGFFMDNQNNRIYRFLTNYIDPNPNLINYPDAEAKMKISMYDINSQTYSTLVEGIFLNFSANNSSYINGINLVENLLFWTDNRNQPRKINVNTALVNPGYYTTETQISVAKYAPVEPISLIRKVVATVTGVTSTTVIEVDDATGIVPGMTIISGAIDSTEFVTVYEVDGNNITLYQEPDTAITIGETLTFLISTMSDQSGDENWPGDPDFLEDKYVRFSYRFRYDDGEYSLMAPFTQIAYIPRQKGYFINGDETAAYRSTIVRWMENNVNNIELLIPLPDIGSNISNSYKITELDILYKESDSNAVKVVETITAQAILSQSPDTNIYAHPYQSQKPYKTLSEEQTVRVFDAVPVRALAQEVSGNRVMYGNYYSTYTAPNSINYNVTVNPKTSFFTNFIEYPNHTLKQNRNYQVGFILADKFGRQSPVILSTVDLNTVAGAGAIGQFGGSTIYAPYVDKEAGYPVTKSWNGNALLVLINSVITSNRNIPNGTPGLYAESIGGVSGFTVNGFSEVNGNDYQFVIDSSVSNSPPKIGDYLRGEYTDYVEVTDLETFGDLYILTTDGQANSLYNLNLANDPDVKYAYRLNQIGWYSYKIVVRQQEQDYYNVYLPGMLNAYPLHQTYGSQVTYVAPTYDPTLENGINTSDFPTNEFNKTAHIVLINDNINKVPRDLTEVGPDQKQYRSSVELFGRVENSVEPVLFDAIGVTNDSTASQFIYDMVMFPSIYDKISIGDNISYASPQPWYANTVITEIIKDSPLVGQCTIKFSPNNITVLTYDTVTILVGKNKQYYPTRKPDTVSSIANSRDFDFFQNTVENIDGTAGLNLYQLQTNPMIGRVSTVTGIGVIGDTMVPYLGVYETRPEESLLDLFWETSSTGLISDLNWDVLTGSDAPVALNQFDSAFFEDQNKDGGGSGTGIAGSPYITDDFFGINSSGTQVVTTNAEIVSVYDNSSPAISSASRFSIESQGAGAYRIKIEDSFVFNHDAPTAGLFTFNIRIQFNNVWYYFSFDIQLGNRAPYFTNLPYDKTIDRTTTVIETLSAVNGSFTNLTTDLYWEINEDSETYFSINQSTGVLSLIDPNIPNGIYEVTATVTDAVDFTQNPPLKLSGSINYESLSDTTTFTIVVIDDPLNEYLRDFNSGPLAYSNRYLNPNGTVISELPFPAGFAAVYVGSVDIAPLDGNLWPDLPSAPICGQRYQNAVNVAKENGYTTLAGLTKGTIRWTVSANLKISPNATCAGLVNPDISDTTNCSVNQILYYRENQNSPWQLATDDNRFNYSTNNLFGSSLAPLESQWGFNTPLWRPLNSPPSTSNLFGGIIEMTMPNYPGPSGIWEIGSELTQEFTFFTSKPGEYCLCIWINDGSRAQCYNFTDIGPYAAVKITDASFTYPPPLNIKTRTAYPYNVSLLTPFDNYPTALASNKKLSQTGEDPTIPNPTPLYGFNFELTAKFNQNPSELNKIVVTEESLANILPGLVVPGAVCKNDTYFDPAHVVKIANITNNIITLTEDTIALLNAGDTFNITYIPGAGGVVYADKAEGINVRQFYTDINMLTPWSPPMPNKYYTFRNLSVSYSNLGDIGHPYPFYLKYPFWTAIFDANGKIPISTQTNPPFVVGFNQNTYIFSGTNEPNVTYLTGPYNTPVTSPQEVKRFGQI